MAKRKKSRPKGRGRVRAVFIAFLIVSAVIALAAAVTFLIVNHRTERILNARGLSSQFGIFSDVRVINRGQKIRPELLRSELARRSYREVSARPQNAGEFRQQGSVFDIQTRPYGAANGRETPGSVVHYKADSGDLSVNGNADDRLFALEPQLVADLTSGDVRAASFAPLAKIPKQMQQAVIAIEDERFYNHFGIDLIGIARAFFINIRAMRLVQGGSTLTQQLAKNLFLSPRRTISRKLLELFTALSLEFHMSKDEILELYLNEVYFGQEGPVAVHGVVEAARNFFGKEVAQLSVAESALLAGIIKAPSSYSPRRHLDRAVERRDVVLAQMHDLKYIDDKTFEQAKNEKARIVDSTVQARRAPHYTAALRQILTNDYNVDPAAFPNLKIYTGLDLEMQRCAEHAVTAGVAELERHNRALQRKTHKLEAGLVAIEPFSGKIRAWAGGRDFSENQFDHVYLAKRPIGSTIKPFVYLTALDGDLNAYKVATVTSILGDEPMTIQQPGSEDWSPENYDHRYRGDVTLRYALENSLNLPTVYLSQKVGLQTVASNIERFHVAKNIPAVPSLALGTVETSLLDLVTSYGALANGGVYVNSRPFMSVLDRDGAQIAAMTVSEERVASDGPVYVLTNLMQGVVERGTATRVRSLGFTGDVAGKTGTTDSARDAWFIGFTPDLAAGVWVGFDDNRRVGLTGGVAAVPIWTEFMKCASEFREPLPFIMPPSVTVTSIDAESGLRATNHCPRENIVEEVFVKGTEPLDFCSLHGGEETQAAPSYDRREHDRDRDFREPPPPRHRKKSLWDQIFG